MSRARDFADLAGSADAGGITGRNLVINGAMQVAQRGDQSSLTSGYTGVDRFTFTRTGAAAVTGKQAGASDSPQSNGFSASLEIDITTADSSLAAGDFALVRQIIEGQNLQGLKYGTSSAENVALSFWVKSPKTGTHIVELYHYDGNVFNSQAYTVNSANTWEHKTLSFVGYQTTATANDNTGGMLVQWWLSAGSTYSGGTLASNTWHTTNANRAVGQVNVTDSTSNNFYLTGVQLEIGSATPFEHRSISEEEALCHRYFYRFTGSTNLFYADYYSNDTLVSEKALPVPMRTTPTVTSRGTGGSGGSAFSHTNLAANPTLTGSGRNSVMVFRGVASTGRAFLHLYSAGADYSVDASAEL